MRKWPVVANGDWVEVFFVEAESREAALIKAAESYIEAVSSPEYQLRLDPAGVSGGGTPNAKLKLFLDEKVVCVYISPIFDIPKQDPKQEFVVRSITREGIASQLMP